MLRINIISKLKIKMKSCDFRKIKNVHQNRKKKLFKIIYMNIIIIKK